jgi:putative addiction module component (TIGR02574 family)
MSVSIKSLGIEQLSVAERLVLVEELWDSIAASTPISEAQRAELDRRLADHESNPDDSFLGKRSNPQSRPGSPIE